MNPLTLLIRLVLPTLVFLIVQGRLGAQVLRPEFPVSHDYLIENWQIEQGLPRNTITTVVQDQLGYLWLGTPYGLVRFDGERLETWGQNVSPQLANGGVKQLLADTNATLWVVSDRFGLLRVAGGGLQRFGMDSLPLGVPVDSVARDKNGILWVTMSDGKLLKLVGDKFVPVDDLSLFAKGPTPFTLITDIHGGLCFQKQNSYGWIENGVVTNETRLSRSVIRFAPARDGGMWLSTGKELRHIFSGQTNSGSIQLPSPSSRYNVGTLYEDRAGTLWVGTAQHGLLRLVKGQLQKIEEVHNAVLSIAEDREGNLWIGTDGGGLFKLRPRGFEMKGMSQGSVLSVSGDWVVSLGKTPRRIRADGGLETDNNVNSRDIISVLDDPAEGVWFGTSFNRLIHFSKEGLRSSFSVRVSPTPNRQLRILHRDQRGNLWIGGNPDGLFLLPVGKTNEFVNLSPQKFGKPVTAITESKNGEVWIGTSLGEVHRWDGYNFVSYGVTNGLEGSPIGALTFSRDGRLWVGTLGGGLGCWSDGKFKFATLAAGLPDNVISQLIEDDAGWLWVGASRGIFRVRISELVEFMAGRRKEVAAVLFGRSEGLENIQCSAGYQPSVWKTAAGELRFATSKGVVTVNPALLPVNLQPPPLVLEQVLVDGVAMTNGAELQLPHDYKQIQFSYAALSFTSPDRVRYRRMLTGFDTGWVEDGRQRMTIYARLPPGRYEFRFTACNNDGIWNEKPVRLVFMVKPAFWQTSWFRAVALLVFASVVAAVARSVSTVRLRRQLQRLEQERVITRERARIARDLHDDLGARLTQMAFLADLTATEPTVSGEVQTQLREVSKQARQATGSLDETVWMVNPEKDSLPHLVEYLRHYADEFFRRTPMRCWLHICLNPPECALSGEVRQQIFFAVKEALTNVLKHSGATEVSFRINVRRPLLRIVITDNGRGFPAATLEKSRHGLANLEHRLREIGGRCVVCPALGGGTRVAMRVRLPLPLSSGRDSLYDQRVAHNKPTQI